MDQKKHMQDLVQQLNKAAAVYYQGTDEIMSNYDYDCLYDELAALEKEPASSLPAAQHSVSATRF